MTPTATLPAADTAHTVAEEIVTALTCARSVGLRVHVKDMIRVVCPDCDTALVFSCNHWQPTGAARLIGLFSMTHPTDSRRTR